MNPLRFPDLAWSVVVIQAVGVASLCAVRFGKRLRCHRECQIAFFLGLSLVGLATLLALHFGTSDWLLNCTTLAVMVLGASLDFDPGPGRRSPAASTGYAPAGPSYFS